MKIDVTQLAPYKAGMQVVPPPEKGKKLLIESPSEDVRAFSLRLTKWTVWWDNLNDSIEKAIYTRMLNCDSVFRVQMVDDKWPHQMIESVESSNAKMEAWVLPSALGITGKLEGFPVFTSRLVPCPIAGEWSHSFLTVRGLLEDDFDKYIVGDFDMRYPAAFATGHFGSGSRVHGSPE